MGSALIFASFITETPVFARVLAEERIERAPSIEVIKRQPKQIILAAFARMGEQAPNYIYITYIFTYGTMVVGASRDFLLVGLLTSGFGIPLGADRRAPIGPDWPQTNVHDCCHDQWPVRIHLFHAA